MRDLPHLDVSGAQGVPIEGPIAGVWVETYPGRAHGDVAFGVRFAVVEWYPRVLSADVLASPFVPCAPTVEAFALRVEHFASTTLPVVPNTGFGVVEELAAVAVHFWLPVDALVLGFESPTHGVRAQHVQRAPHQSSCCLANIVAFQEIEHLETYVIVAYHQFHLRATHLHPEPEDLCVWVPSKRTANT